MLLTIDASNLRRGGGVTHLIEILKAVDVTRYNISSIDVWAPRQTLEQIHATKHLNLKSHPMIERGRLASVYFRSRILDRLIGSEVDLLWVPGGTYTGNFRPYVTMLRNLLPFDAFECDRFKYSSYWLRLKYLRRVQLRSFRGARGLIHISENAQETLNRLVDLNHVKQTVIYHGLSERFLMLPREQLSFEAFSIERPIRVLYVSHINLYKHQDKLVEAIARLRRKGMPIELNLVGPALPAAKNILDRVIARHDPLGKWVRWHGEVPYHEVQRFYRDTDICAYMSTCETFGNILLEAMGSGLPILSSNRCALPEISNGACLEVDTECIDTVESELERLIRDQNLRKKLSIAAYQRAQDFTWKRCADETFKFLAECSRRK